jgi:hypothetical protein
MASQEQVDVIIYRVRDTGLEVFLVNHSHDTGDQWQAPGIMDPETGNFNNFIELEPVTGSNGESRKAIAIEADWHEIPSLRALIYEDYRVAKEKAKERIKSMIPGTMEKGAFFAVKEAFKRIMPEQYAFVKELKDVLLDKEQTKYI